jgi:hypothetical protein
MTSVKRKLTRKLARVLIICSVLQFVVGNKALAGQENQNRAQEQPESASGRQQSDAGTPAVRDNFTESRRNLIPALLAILKHSAESQNTGVILPNDKEEAKRVEEEMDAEARIEAEALKLAGLLRVEEAVPLLIKIMEERGTFILMEKGSAEMTALAQIGPAAVPAVMESIEDANTTTERNRENGCERCPDAFRIQIRGAHVLGDIGDPVALPLLELLLQETKTLDYWWAIQQIKKKNWMEYDRVEYERLNRPLGSEGPASYLE